MYAVEASSRMQSESSAVWVTSACRAGMRASSLGEGGGEREMSGEQRSSYMGDLGVEVSWEVERRWLWLVLGGFVNVCWG
jgi:hypothetical protein